MKSGRRKHWLFAKAYQKDKDYKCQDRCNVAQNTPCLKMKRRKL